MKHPRFAPRHTQWPDTGKIAVRSPQGNDTFSGIEHAIVTNKIGAIQLINKSGQIVQAQRKSGDYRPTGKTQIE